MNMVTVERSEARVITTDVFLYVPLELVHKIMLLLPKSDLTRMSVLSKFFLRAFRSLPVLDIDFDLFLEKTEFEDVGNAQHFLQFATNSIQSCNIGIGGVLERVSFNSKYFHDTGIPEDRLIISNAIKAVADFAVENKAKELNFYFYLMSLPGLEPTLFRARSLKTLKLTGLSLDIPLQILVLDCPLLEEFRLHSCTFTRNDMTFKVTSPMLKTANFHRTKGLWRIEIDPASAMCIESFTYAKHRDLMDSCEIVNLASCTSLKFLKLKTLNGTDELWTANSLDVSVHSALEVLILKECKSLTTLLAHGNLRLKSVSLMECLAMERVDIIAPNLDFFEHSLYSPLLEHHLERQCEINIEGCKKLKDLRLRHVNVSNLGVVSWRLIRFHFLENLVLSDINLLVEVVFRSECLKRLEIAKCVKLQKIEIDVPNLVSFVYIGDALALPPIIASMHLVAKLQFVSEDHDCKVFRNFISHFGHCKTLTISSPSSGLFSFPWEERDSLVSPLYDLQHLNIELSNAFLDITTLIDNLLWLVPHPKTISITFGSKLFAIIKFYFKDCDEMEDDEEDEMACCSTLIMKCWRHNLMRVEVEGFEGFGKESNDCFQRYFCLIMPVTATLSIEKGSQK